MIWGPRVGIRPIEASDQAFIHRLNSDPMVRGHVVGWDWPSSVSQQERWFAASPPTSTHRWLVVDSSGSAVGLTGLWDVDWHNRHALTALKLGGDGTHRGKGLGTEAIKLVMAFAFYDVGLERLHSTILSDNTASLRAYVHNSGWTLEGTARRHVWRHGDFQDVSHIGVLKSEFDLLSDAREYVLRVTKGGQPTPAAERT